MIVKLMAKKKSGKKPKLSERDRGALRRIMKTVREIRIWDLKHRKAAK